MTGFYILVSEPIDTYGQNDKVRTTREVTIPVQPALLEV